MLSSIPMEVHIDKDTYPIPTIYLERVLPTPTAYNTIYSDVPLTFALSLIEKNPYIILCLCQVLSVNNFKYLKVWIEKDTK